MGPLESVRILGPGIAEVVFKYKDDALEAFKKYNQRNLDGQPMFCRIQAASRTRLSAPAGTSGLGGGAYGGRCVCVCAYGWGVVCVCAYGGEWVCVCLWRESGVCVLMEGEWCVC